MKKRKSFLVLLILIGLMTAIPQIVFGWLDGWTYQREITLDNATSIDNYQVKVELTSANFDYSHALANGEDIRFTDVGEVLQDYWIEEWCIDDTSTIWVEVQTSGTTTLNMYYGNPLAPSTSSGGNTFEFFDDFENITGTTSMHADNAASYLIIPTYDGSGQAIHPDVIHFDTAWNGYTYWMCMTPYPNGNNTYENPSIVASNDGQNWEVPAGLTNPLFTPTMGYCNDPNLVYNDTSDELWIYWVNSNSPGHRTLRKTSSDGVNWSAEEVCSGLQEGGTPAVIKENGTYYMWEGASVADHAHLSHSTDGINWTYDGHISATLPSGAHRLWHLNVFDYDNKYIGLFCMQMSAGGYWLYYAESTDKLNWTIQEESLLTPSASGWDNSYIYQTAGEYSPDGSVLKLWYTGRASNGAWHTGYTEATEETIYGGAWEDWTTIQGPVDYSSTNQAYSDPHSMQIGASEASPRTEATVTHSNSNAIQFRLWKEPTVAYPILHGDNGGSVYTKIDNNSIWYHNGSSWNDTGYDITGSAWNLFEFRDFDWSAHTYDIVLGTTVIANDAGMHPTTNYNDILHLENGNTGLLYYDNVLVRKYTGTDPVATVGEETTSSVSPPSNVTISISGNDVILNWEWTGERTTYNVYRSTDPYSEDFEIINVLSILGTTYTDFGAAATETKYFYYITANE